MTTLTSNDSFSSNTATSIASGLALHVVQPGKADQTVSLPAGKCTVGSSERCQVALADGQVRPLHCLIVSDGVEATVTRWAPGAQLNGQDFATSPFLPGDCLQIGTVQLSLIAAANTTNATPQQETPAERSDESLVGNAFASLTPAASRVDCSTENLTAAETAAESVTPSAVKEDQPEPVSSVTPVSSTVSAASQIEADRMVSQLWTANFGARKRCRQLVSTLRTVRSQVDGFDQKVDDLQQQLNSTLAEREQIFTQLSQLQEEAAGRETQSTEEIDRLIAELTAAYEKATAAEAAVAEQSRQTEEIQQELDSLKSQREEQEQVRSAGELQRSKLAQALADREQSIETLQAELEQAHEAANRADSSRADQVAELADLQQQFEQVHTEREQLAAAQAGSQQYREEIEQALADSEQNLAVFQLELEKFQLTSRQTDQELRESVASYDALQVEFQQLAEERDQLAAKRTEYQLREQGWEHELTSRDSQVEQLTDEIAQLRIAADDAAQDVATQLSQVGGFEQQLSALTTERDQLLLAQAEQVEKIQQWEETVATRDRRIQELEEEHEGICHVLQSVEEGAFEQVDFCNKLEKQLAAVREERDQLANAMPEQGEYIKKLEQTLSEREGQISLLSEELTKTAEQHDALEAELATGTSAFQALESELAKLSTHCEELATAQNLSEQNRANAEQSLAESQSRFEDLQQQIETVQQQRQELEQIVADGSHSSESLESELGELRASYEQLTAEHLAETERRQELDQLLVDRQQNIELFQVDLKSMKAELDRTTEQVSSLQTEREAQDQQLSELRDELASQELAAQELASQEKISEAADLDLKQQRDDLATELSALRLELEKVQQQAVAVTEGHDATSELVAQLESEKSLLEQKIEQQDLAVQQLSDESAAELQDARSQISASQCELEQLNQSYQQSQHDLEQALQCLQAAEQALQDRVVDPAPVEQASAEEPVSVDRDGQIEASAEGASGVWGTSADSESWQEPESFQETGYQEVNAEGEGVETAEVAHQDPNAIEQADEWPVEDPTGGDLASGDLASTDLVIDESSQDDETTPEATEWGQAESAPVAESFGSASTAFDAPTEVEEPVEEFQPPSFIDQYQHLLEGDGVADVEPVQPVQPAPGPVVNKLGAELDSLAADGDVDSDQADLDAYMSNMLARMRGDQSDDAVQAPQTENEAVINQNPNPVAAVDQVLDRVAAGREVAEEVPTTEPMDLEELRQSSRKPALSADLSAMRELANSSARRAIAKHHKRRHLEKAFGLFLVCLIFICVGGYLLLTAGTAQQFLSLSFVGGSVAVLVGVVGGFKLLGLLMLVIREGTWEKKPSERQVVANADGVNPESVGPTNAEG